MGNEGLIDPRDIARRYSFSEHAEKANRYFATLTLDAGVARKPFASPLEVPDVVSGISAIVSGLKLFHGAKVLDFGAGTCWFSRLLAMMGCEVTAADVSANALRIGKQLIDGDPLAKHLNVSYATLDGPKLPFPDASFDRIVVFDAFHHCPDQVPMIGEFHRVLRDGGIAAFHEAGPNHSRTPQSQFEMRQFDVIEGDIVVEDLFAEAQRVGFSKAQLALYAAYPAMVDLDQHNAFLADEGVGAQLLVQQARLECDNRRVFFLHKGDTSVTDSRTALGLLAGLDLSAKIVDGEIAISGRIVNVGPGTWLPSNGGVGSVNIGVHLKDLSGATLDNDYARLTLASTPSPHATEIAVAGTIPLPMQDRVRIVIDLVAEGVTWFEIGGTRPAVFEIADGAIRAP